MPWGILLILGGPMLVSMYSTELTSVLKRSELVWTHADMVRAHCCNPALPSTYKNAESLIISRWLKVVCDSLSFSHTYSEQKVAEEQPKWWPYLLKSLLTDQTAWKGCLPAEVSSAQSSQNGPRTLFPSAPRRCKLWILYIFFCRIEDRFLFFSYSRRVLTFFVILSTT